MVNASRTQRLARLLTVLHAGEVLAARTAAAQARLAPLPWMRRALATQAAQERRHAWIAHGALQIIGTPTRTRDVTAALDARLQRDLAAGHLAASLIGLQGVIEHLGEALLEFLGGHEHPTGALLHPLRRHVLAQEQGHVALGARCLAALPPLPAAQVYAEYCELGRGVARDVACLAEDARLDGSAFWREVQARLAAWQATVAAP